MDGQWTQGWCEGECTLVKTKLEQLVKKSYHKGATHKFLPKAHATCMTCKGEEQFYTSDLEYSAQLD